METVIEKNYNKISVLAKEPVPVLHIIKSLGRGGAETLLPETLTKHDKGKYTFHYIYFLPWKFQMVEEIERAGGKVTCFAANNNLQIFKKVFKLVQYVKKHQIKLIHCHLPWAGIVGRMVGKITGVPVVYTEHNIWEQYHKFTYHLNKLSFGSQNTVIAVSGDVAKSIHKHYQSDKPKVQVVANGINTEKYAPNIHLEKDIRNELGIAQSTIVIGIACVFRAEKRLHVWLEIAKAIHDKHPDTAFIVVGDGGLKEELFAQADRNSMQGYLHFVGLQTEVRPYMKAMDIFMMSSEFEGLPIALLEAMGMGCMPACTDAGGIAELLQDHNNGVIVPVAQPLLLVDKISQYIQQPDKMQQLKKAARETVIHHYSLQKMVAELETIYDELIK